MLQTEVILALALQLPCMTEYTYSSQELYHMVSIYVLGSATLTAHLQVLPYLLFGCSLPKLRTFREVSGTAESVNAALLEVSYV